MQLFNIFSVSGLNFCENFPGMWLIQTFFSLFFAILFLQSGLDKVLDWSGNVSWLKEHFSKTPFKNSVPLLVFTLTGFELAAGLSSLIGVVAVIAYKNFFFAFIGVVLALSSFLMLFFGQRLAKDYAGAVSIATYFIIAIIDLYLLL